MHCRVNLSIRERHSRDRKTLQCQHTYKIHNQGSVVIMMAVTLKLGYNSNLRVRGKAGCVPVKVSTLPTAAGACCRTGRRCERSSCGWW